MKTLVEILNSDVLINEKFLALVENKIYDAVEKDVDGIIITEINHIFTPRELVTYYQNVIGSNEEDIMEFYTKRIGNNIIVKYIKEFDAVYTKYNVCLVQFKGENGFENCTFSKVVNNSFFVSIPQNYTKALEK